MSEESLAGLRWGTSLVEVDIHALQLEVGRAIVPVSRQPGCLASVVFRSHTRRSRRGRARQKWSARRRHRFGYPSASSVTCSSYHSWVCTYALAGLEVNLHTYLSLAICFFIVDIQTRGTRAGQGGCSVGCRRTISRIFASDGGACCGRGWGRGGVSLSVIESLVDDE